MRRLLGIVLDDNLFAVVVGAVAAGFLSLMAWIVSKLFDVDTRVKILEWVEAVRKRDDGDR